MKKIISLLLICSMIFSMALVGSAAVEGYIVTSGKINSTTGRFYLNVASKTDAFCGYITIKYDPEKVTLLKQVKTQTGEDDEGNAVYSTTYEEYTSGNFAVAQSGCSFADQKADVSKGNIVVQWFNTSKVSAGANVFRLWFVAKDKSGDSFTESTFTLITNEAERKALGAEYGAAYIGNKSGANFLLASDVTWSYKNSNVIPVTSVTVKPDYLETKIGVKTQLRVTCSPSSATNKSITWSSNNTKVVTVDSNGYVTGKSAGTATITAKSNNGKKAKCTVTVKNKNIIDYDEYEYSFSNWYDSFGYPYHRDKNNNAVSDYVIPRERYEQLGRLKGYSGEKWGGSCFGMSASSILFYKNILQEERYDKSVSKPYYFGAPDDNTEVKTKLRQMIELFQISQCTPFVKGNLLDFSVSKVVNELSNGNPVLFGMHERTKKGEVINGHAVVIYGYTYTNKKYVFNIYDCAGYVDKFTYPDNKLNYLGKECNWNEFEYATYETLNGIYERIKQVNQNKNFTLFSLEEEPAYIYIFRPAENITVTNSKGEVSVIDGGDAIGEIEDISVITSSYMAAEPTYTIILPTDTYTIVGNSDDIITTSFADDYMSADVTAKSSAPITISSDLKKISVDTEANEDYSVQYTTYDNIFDEMSLTGKASGKISSSLSESEILVSGIDTLTATASVSESTVSASSENLSENGEITVKCENSDSGATIQILTADAELTEKTALPERLTVESPAYDLESGEYTEGQKLTFTKDNDTIVYYTTDGTAPSADNGFIYSLPIDINKSMTIKAISTKYGYSDSEVIELNYILPEVDAPKANVESGEYDNIISVELSTEEINDEIYYTLDGSDPLENGILYTVPLNISEDTYLQAYSLRNGCISETSEYLYTIASAYPFYFSNSLKNQNEEIITADNIADVTKVKLTLSKLQSGEHTGTFLIAFYGENDKLLYMNCKTGTISENGDEVEIDIGENVASAQKIKVFAWDGLSTLKPMCNALEEIIAE